MEQIGPYRLERHLATGGMADVWLATQEGPEGFRKEVVIKRIRGLRADDVEFRTMFLDEARLTARLNHPNIVQIHELGEEDGEFYVAMEYVEGSDLADVLERDGRLPWHIALHIAEQLLLALIFVGELEDDGARLDVVHRDISPSNVLLSATGHVKLADFGVAKALSNHHRTQTGATKGKLSYMSPEQVRADELDARSDLFALGVNLYEWITGVLPFGSGVRALHAIQAEMHEPVGDLAEVPVAVAALIDRALAKAPEARFQNAEEMHDAIIEVFRSEAAHAGRQDVATLVATGPVAATQAAVPGVMPTRVDDSTPPVSNTETVSPSATQTPTAVVGARGETASIRAADPPDKRRPARLPWILIGVLFGVLIAGGASTFALMGESNPESDRGAAEENPDQKDGKDEKSQREPAKSKKSRGKKAKAGGEEAEREREKELEREEKEREKELEREEKEREKRRKKIEKKLERERKHLEKKAKKMGGKELRKLLGD